MLLRPQQVFDKRIHISLRNNLVTVRDSLTGQINRQTDRQTDRQTEIKTIYHLHQMPLRPQQVFDKRIHISLRNNLRSNSLSSKRGRSWHQCWGRWCEIFPILEAIVFASHLLLAVAITSIQLWRKFNKVKYNLWANNQLNTAIVNNYLLLM